MRSQSSARTWLETHSALLCRRAGLQRHVTWLTLRHTAAALMFDAGLTLFEVQQRLDHESPTMTAEVYTHLMRERFDEGRKRMEDYMLTKRPRTT